MAKDRLKIGDRVKYSNNHIDLIANNSYVKRGYIVNVFESSYLVANLNSGWCGEYNDECVKHDATKSKIKPPKFLIGDRIVLSSSHSNKYSYKSSLTTGTVIGILNKGYLIKVILDEDVQSEWSCNSINKEKFSEVYGAPSVVKIRDRNSKLDFLNELQKAAELINCFDKSRFNKFLKFFNEMINNKEE